MRAALCALAALLSMSGCSLLLRWPDEGLPCGQEGECLEGYYCDEVTASCLDRADRGPFVFTQAVAAARKLIALRDDGTVWGWGEGTLGDGHDAGSFQPVRVELRAVKAIAAGGATVLLLKKDGTAWTFGSDAHGQLGDDDPLQASNVPVRVPGVEGAIAGCVGYSHAMVLLSDQTLMAWGNNDLGQLGDGTNTERHAPVPVRTLTQVKALSCNAVTSMAVRTDGTVWSWGGRIGSTPSNEPTQVGGLADVEFIANGAETAYAITVSGQTYAWGAHTGNGTSDYLATPTRVPALSSFTHISISYQSSVALDAAGTVWTWGRNAEGEMGSGSTSTAEQLAPWHHPTLGGAVQSVAGAKFSAVRVADGSLWAWGENGSGQLGRDPVLGTPVTSPVNIPVPQE